MEQNHVVVWFDPEKQYEGLAGNLSLPGIPVFHYKDSFFSLRHEVDPLMAGSEPPSCIIYVPLAEEQTEDALVCYTAFGAVMKPGQNPWQRNTRLSIITRNALKSDLDEKALCAIEKQVEQGQLRFEDLDNLKDMTAGTPDVISVIFNTGNAHDILLGFLNSDSFDGEILKKHAVSDLCQTVDRSLGTSLSSELSLSVIRENVARAVLTTSFLAELEGDVPPALSGVKMPIQAQHREECKTIAKKWRMRSDLRKSFISFAQQIDQELNLRTIPFTFEQMASSEIFPTFEKRLQALVEEKMLHGASDDLISLSEAHESSFWSHTEGEIVTRWSLIIVAGRLLHELDRISTEMKAVKLSAHDLIERYSSGDRPWCIIDSLYRNLGCSYLHYEGIGECESLGRLVQAASTRYMDVGGALAEPFVKTFQK